MMLSFEGNASVIKMSHKMPTWQDGIRGKPRGDLSIFFAQ
jgi:hypothetical protein